MKLAIWLESGKIGKLSNLLSYFEFVMLTDITDQSCYLVIYGRIYIFGVQLPLSDPQKSGIGMDCLISGKWGGRRSPLYPYLAARAAAGVPGVLAGVLGKSYKYTLRYGAQIVVPSQNTSAHERLVLSSFLSPSPKPTNSQISSARTIPNLLTPANSIIRLPA
jgi:hypothetical protein